jgi:hypothetical protein
MVTVLSSPPSTEVLASWWPIWHHDDTDGDSTNPLYSMSTSCHHLLHAVIICKSPGFYWFLPRPFMAQQDLSRPIMAQQDHASGTLGQMRCITECQLLMHISRCLHFSGPAVALEAARETMWSYPTQSAGVKIWNWGNSPYQNWKLLVQVELFERGTLAFHKLSYNIHKYLNELSTQMLWGKLAA